MDVGRVRRKGVHGDIGKRDLEKTARPVERCERKKNGQKKGGRLISKQRGQDGTMKP